jgi:hypothetical protein
MRLCYNYGLRQFTPSWGDPQTITAQALTRLIGLGQAVTVHSPSTEPTSPKGIIQGRLIGLDNSGALLIAGPQGTLAVWSGTLVLG